jgi:uncharacterized membrane protein
MVVEDHREVEVQVIDGKKRHARIVQAIQEGEELTTSEIHVHISKRFFEGDPLESAKTIFQRYRLFQTSQRNSVLLYINFRRRKLAIYGDIAVHQAVGQNFWEGILSALKSDLQSLRYEDAIITAVKEISIKLKSKFPAHPNQSNPNELVNEVTED